MKLTCKVIIMLVNHKLLHECKVQLLLGILKIKIWKGTLMSSPEGKPQSLQNPLVN